MEAMQESEVIREAMKARGMRQKNLALMLGVTQSALSNSICRMRMSVSVLKEVLDGMDYDLVVVDRRNGEAVWKVKP